MKFSRRFLGDCHAISTMAVWAICVLMNGVSEVKAQGLVKRKHMGVGLGESDLKKRYVKPKPGAYLSDGLTICHKVEVPGLAGVNSSFGIIPFTGVGLVGYSIGFKVPLRKLRSQIIPTAGINIGMGLSVANRIEISTEWRVFPFGHDKDLTYDWGSPWLGVGANLGNCFLAGRVYNSTHYGAFMKVGTGFLAFFFEYGFSPVLGDEINNAIENLLAENFPEEANRLTNVTSSLRAFRLGLLLEF